MKSSQATLRMTRALIVMIFFALLTGCAETNLGQLEQTLADIRQSPVGQPPTVAVALPEHQDVRYVHSDGRSPFLPPEAITQGSANRNEGALAPDRQRTPEPLESFPLQELRLVGTMRMAGRQVAMIASPDGSVTSVKLGNYMGTDYGRIADIGAQEVRVVERVFTQREGWQEREVTLALNAERTPDE